MWGQPSVAIPVPVVAKSVGKVGERGDDEGATWRIAPDMLLSAEAAGLCMSKMAPEGSARGRSVAAMRAAPGPKAPLLGKEAGGSLEGERLQSESS